VLFSEPKIPQSHCVERLLARCAGFSALQRAENSSMVWTLLLYRRVGQVSVLFSEPKIPQSCS